MVLSNTQAQETQGFRTIVNEQLHRYPKMEVQDIYKLALQASLGVEHFMEDTAAMLSYLRDEMRQLDATDREPLMERITPDSSLVRVNLRPYKARGGDAATLIHAMLITAETYRGTRMKMFAYWGTIELMAEEKFLPFKKKELEMYFKKRARERFPATHHSQTYERNYNPAYRVVLRSSLTLLTAAGTK